MKRRILLLAGLAALLVVGPPAVDGGGNTYHAPDLEPPDPRQP